VLTKKSVLVEPVELNDGNYSVRMPCSPSSSRGSIRFGKVSGIKPCSKQRAWLSAISVESRRPVAENKSVTAGTFIHFRGPQALLETIKARPLEQVLIVRIINLQQGAPS